MGEGKPCAAKGVDLTVIPPELVSILKACCSGCSVEGKNIQGSQPLETCSLKRVLPSGSELRNRCPRPLCIGPCLYRVISSRSSPSKSPPSLKHPTLSGPLAHRHPFPSNSRPSSNLQVNLREHQDAWGPWIAAYTVIRSWYYPSHVIPAS